jgi:hypothetical protein
MGRSWIQRGNALINNTFERIQTLEVVTLGYPIVRGCAHATDRPLWMLLRAEPSLPKPQQGGRECGGYGIMWCGNLVFVAGCAGRRGGGGASKACLCTGVFPSPAGVGSQVNGAYMDDQLSGTLLQGNHCTCRSVRVCVCMFVCLSAWGSGGDRSRPSPGDFL